MAPCYDVVIIGGGVGGCAAAIHLGRQGHSVLLLEAGHPPGHKLCGEFLSPAAQRLLGRLGLLGAACQRGAVPIRQVRLSVPGAPGLRAALPGTGLGLSRHALDPLLLAAARAAGATVRCDALAEWVTGDEAGGFTVRYRHHGAAAAAHARLVIGAWGRRARIDRVLGRCDTRVPLQGGHGLVAVAAHYRPLLRRGGPGDAVELHALPGGSCGISPIEGGEVNVCLVARQGALRPGARTLEGLARPLIRRSEALCARLAGLVPLSRPLSITQLQPGRRPLFSNGVLMVGDTAALGAPLWGDGVAMALRGAELAAPICARYLGGDLPLAALAREYGRAWEAEFRQRLWLGRLAQEAMMRPLGWRLGLYLLRRLPGMMGTLLGRDEEDDGLVPALPGPVSGVYMVSLLRGGG